MFYTLGVSGCPHICTPPVHLCAPYICMPPGCTHPHMPPYTFMPLCVFGGYACCGGCNGLPFMLGHPPYIRGCLPFYTPTLICWFPVHQYVSGISVCYLGICLLSVRVWGVSPISWGVEGASAFEMSICSFLYLFF